MSGKVISITVKQKFDINKITNKYIIEAWNEAIEAAAQKADMNNDWIAHEIRKLKQ